MIKVVAKTLANSKQYKRRTHMKNSSIKIFACGDVMTGRGIDQIQRHPSQPQIYEDYVKDARDYVKLVEAFHEALPRRVHPNYIWGDALSEWGKRHVDAKIINLETAITTSNSYWPNKGINYRMHPLNIEVLKNIDSPLCALANNHILDWGIEGLKETITTLKDSGINYAGAGLNLAEATRPYILNLPSGNRLLFFSVGTYSSGIPLDWTATRDNPGIYLLNTLTSVSIEELKKNVAQYRKPGDLVVLSIHWGGNWNYEIASEQTEFAHAVIDTCHVDMIHGHSSHHPLGIELYQHKPIIYGCGDFINDYEGIVGKEEYRGDLALMYFLEFDKQSLLLNNFEIVPLQMKKFQLHYAGINDCRWISHNLNTHSHHFETAFKLCDDGVIQVKRANSHKSAESIYL